MARAAGVRALLKRALHAAPAPAALGTLSTHQFCEPSPIDSITLRVGVMVHVYYPELFKEIAAALANLQQPFTLLVSVVDTAAEEEVREALHNVAFAERLVVRRVANRGRNFAPLLVDFRDDILQLDVICHVHTKKSLYTGKEQCGWRRYLLGSLLGSPERTGWILGMFQAESRLGLVYPDTYATIPVWAHTWLGNMRPAADLGARLGVAIDPANYIDYPVGGMFWARVSTLRPLYELELQASDFPEERGQTDGTLQHALERFIVLVARHSGHLPGILPSDGRLQLAIEGDRNWHPHFELPFATRLKLSAVGARLVSLDLFDTLVLRPFLRPEDARACLAEEVERQFGIPDFDAIRTRAEQRARTTLGRDVTLDDVYREIARVPGCSGHSDRLRDLELSLEARWLRARPHVVDAVESLVSNGVATCFVSDMYLSTDEVLGVLPPEVRPLAPSCLMSCETGWRKDDGTAWAHLPGHMAISPADWLHVGDNEHSDVQRPLDLGFRAPIHVLRPHALLDVVPSLRPLRPRVADGGWHGSLIFGLLANHLTNLADRDPATFLPTLTLRAPESFGYCALGPVLFDYSAWLCRSALDERVERILFLSREGHLLKQAFELLQRATPALRGIKAVYLLASRRGVGTPTLRDASDLASLFDGSYTGTLQALLEARLGKASADAAVARLGSAAGRRDVYLPEMRVDVLSWLEPALADLLTVAARERVAYQRYWSEVGGPGLVADLGYAGTIQSRLANLTGALLGGAYFLTRPGIEQVQVHGGWAKARYQEDRNLDEAGCPVAKLHLLLETVVSATEGQFSHFDVSGDCLVPVFLPREHDPHIGAIIHDIQKGALSYVEDVVAMVPGEAHALDVDSGRIQVPLDCVAAGTWQLGAWADDLRLGDAFTGRGALKVAAGSST